MISSTGESSPTGCPGSRKPRIATSLGAWIGMRVRLLGCTGRMSCNGQSKHANGVDTMDVSDDLAAPLQVQMNWLNHLNVFCVHAAHSGDLDLASLSNNNVEALRQELTIPDRCLSLGKYCGRCQEHA